MTVLSKTALGLSIETIIFTGKEILIQIKLLNNKKFDPEKFLKPPSKATLPW
jgi:hypothetical protein